MGWLAIIRLALQAVSALAKWAGDRQLIAAGEAQAVAAGNTETLNALAKVQASRVALDDPSTGRADRVRDRFTRPE